MKYEARRAYSMTRDVMQSRESVYVG